MNEEMEKIYETLCVREIEIKNLRQGYIITSHRYTEALESLKILTINTAYIANQVAVAAVKSLLASKKAALAVEESVVTVTRTAAVEAAMEAAAAANAASKAAEQAADAVVKTVSRHAELEAAEAAKEVRAALERATTAATEAAKIADNVSSMLTTKQ